MKWRPINIALSVSCICFRSNYRFISSDAIIQSSVCITVLHSERHSRCILIAVRDRDKHIANASYASIFLHPTTKLNARHAIRRTAYSYIVQTVTFAPWQHQCLNDGFLCSEFACQMHIRLLLFAAIHDLFLGEDFFQESLAVSIYDTLKSHYGYDIYTRCNHNLPPDDIFSSRQRTFRIHFISQKHLILGISRQVLYSLEGTLYL